MPVRLGIANFFEIVINQDFKLNAFSIVNVEKQKLFEEVFYSFEQENRRKRVGKMTNDKE